MICDWLSIIKSILNPATYLFSYIVSIMRISHKLFLVIAGIWFFWVFGLVNSRFSESIIAFNINVFSTTLDTSQSVAKAYIQAVTNGAWSKIVPGIVDYSTCNSSNQWNDACQRSVYNWKDGKTLFMESLTAENIAELIPANNALWAMWLDPFTYLTNCPTKYYAAGCGWTTSTSENGWYAYIANNKKILRDYFIVTAKNDSMRIAVAKAYIQAVTNGAGSKIVPGVVDFSTCNSSKQWDDACQRSVYDWKDGKTLFMESITADNILIMMPKENAKIATGMDIFKYLSTTGNGWYTVLGAQKTILFNYLTSTLWGPVNALKPGMADYFDGVLIKNATKMTIDIKIKEFPKDYVPSDILYFWALTVNFSNVPGIDMEYWGHLGSQYASSCWSPDSKCADWWGGGNLADRTYWIGGRIVKLYPWKLNTPYTYSIERGTKNPSGTTKLWEGKIYDISGTWNWNGKILDKSTGIVTDMGNVFWGEYIITDGFKDSLRSTNLTIDCRLPINMKHNLCKANPYIMTETWYGVNCNSPSAKVEWSNPRINDLRPPILVNTHANDCATNVSQKILMNDTLNVIWTNETNSIPWVNEKNYNRTLLSDEFGWM